MVSSLPTPYVTPPNWGAQLNNAIESRYQAALSAIEILSGEAVTRIGGDTATASPAVIYNVADYGAVGDGTSDDSTAIQAALTAAGDEGGGIVYLPRSQFPYLTGTTTLRVPNYVSLKGVGRRASILSYTGTGTAIEVDDLAAAEWKYYINFEDFLLHAPDAATGFNLKGWNNGTMARVTVFGTFDDNGVWDGDSYTTTPTAGVGVLLDGSYGGDIGCWWNVIDHCQFIGWDNAIKLTGVVGDGQANGNTITNNVFRVFNRGVWVHIGDTSLVSGNDFTSRLASSEGVRVEDSQCRILGNRFEQTDIAVRLAASGANWAELAHNSISSSVDVGVQIDNAASGKRLSMYGRFNNALTPINDLSNQSTDGTALNYLGMGQLVPITFYRANVAAGLTSSGMDIAGATNVNTFSVGRAYHVRGISVRSGDARTAGTLTIKPAVGGVESATLSAVLDGTNTTIFTMYAPFPHKRNVEDVSITNASTTITHAGSAPGFTSADTGRTIRIPGAGSGGNDLITTVTFVSATELTAGSAASTTVSGVTSDIYDTGMVNLEGKANGVGAKITTDGSWAPTTADVEVTVWVEFLP